MSLLHFITATYGVCRSRLIINNEPTSAGKTQGTTGYIGIVSTPIVITDCPPLVVQTDLNSAFIVNITPNQSQLSIGAWSYKRK